MICLHASCSGDHGVSKKMEALLRDYMSEWQKQSYKFNEPNSPFYERWALLIELVTGVKIANAESGLQRYGLASTCAILISQRCNIELTY